jgi:L-ribulose-5-phosphate 3-epimerase
MYLACTSESYAPLLDHHRLTVPEWFRLCAEELRIPAVEIEDRHIGEPTPQRLKEIRSAADRYGLEIVNVAFMNDFAFPDADRQAEIERTVRWIEAAPHLKTRFLRTFAGWPKGERQARWPTMIQALTSVARKAEAAGVRLVLENHNHDGFIQTADDVASIFDAVKSPALGLLLDSGNYLDGLASIQRTARLAWHVHAKFKHVQPDGRDANVDNQATLNCLRQAGYAGCVSVEYEGEEPGATAVPRALGYLRALITGKETTD